MLTVNILVITMELDYIVTFLDYSGGSHDFLAVSKVVQFHKDCQGVL